ncbi:hypothetical protein AALO_G00020300 [Alosa alosa]|uniref:Uncharacterized protein n=1 Tax=Alosa alosa TaxID=278164 RepID=A0AAV6H9I9_9TELE|nr:hypothetical protein AALO_G00020300 [Alosa alosa]
MRQPHILATHAEVQAVTLIKDLWFAHCQSFDMICQPGLGQPNFSRLTMEMTEEDSLNIDGNSGIDTT